MAATTRSRVVELSTHSSTQVFTFYLLAAACTVILFQFVAAPVLGSFFQSFLRSEVVKDGSLVSYQISANRQEEVTETGMLTTWALVDPQTMNASPRRVRDADGNLTIQPKYTAEYVFRPLIALAPLVLVGGFVFAAFLTVLIPGGFLAQKIEREVLVALDRLAYIQYGEHTPQEIAQLTKEIIRADARRLHDLSDIYGMPFADIDLLQKALHWRDANSGGRLFKTHDAIKFYMREYFTDRYSNAVLGLVYMGAAVLIIVIGIRGLKFLPSTDPSAVLGALGLEFMLLITYAMLLMYSPSEEQSAKPLSMAGGGGSSDIGNDGDTEKLLRAFLAVPRSKNSSEKS